MDTSEILLMENNNEDKPRGIVIVDGAEIIGKMHSEIHKLTNDNNIIVIGGAEYMELNGLMPFPYKAPAKLPILPLVQLRELIVNDGMSSRAKRRKEERDSKKNKSKR